MLLENNTNIVDIFYYCFHHTDTEALVKCFACFWFSTRLQSEERTVIIMDKCHKLLIAIEIIYLKSELLE